MTGYRADPRCKVVKRLQELEGQMRLAANNLVRLPRLLAA